jgi:CDP-diacylglycerol--serine O-phosphatidyltransferase
MASVFAFSDVLEGRDRLWVLLVVVVPGVLMVTNIRWRSFRSLVSPKSRRPYGLVTAAVLIIVGLATVPVLTFCLVAYGYLFSPLLVPLVSPLGKLVPARVKELLS